MYGSRHYVTRGQEGCSWCIWGGRKMKIRAWGGSKGWGGSTPFFGLHSYKKQPILLLGNEMHNRLLCLCISFTIVHCEHNNVCAKCYSVKLFYNRLGMRPECDDIFSTTGGSTATCLCLYLPTSTQGPFRCCTISLNLGLKHLSPVVDLGSWSMTQVNSCLYWGPETLDYQAKIPLQVNIRPLLW